MMSGNSEVPPLEDPVAQGASEEIEADVSPYSNLTPVVTAVPQMIELMHNSPIATAVTETRNNKQSTLNSTHSLTSSTYEYHYAHGHRYHRNGEALLPNDDTEQDRLDLQHHIFKLVLDGRLTLSEIPENTHTMLDVGTGTGIWAIEMGDTRPSATIIGIDHSHIQPAWVPPNVMFEIDDVNKPWLQRAESLDFVYIRTMAGSITSWPDLLAEAYKCLKPGGQIEFVEFALRWECSDGTFDPKGNCATWTRNFHKIAEEILGIDFDPIPKMGRWMGDVGFEDVSYTDRIVPVGPWPKDRKLKNIGRYFLSNMLESGVENYTMALFTKGGWDTTSVHAMLGGVRRELLDSRIHAYTRAWFVTARKPVSGVT